MMLLTAVVAIVVFAAWRIGSRALKNKVLWVLAALRLPGRCRTLSMAAGAQMIDGLALGETTPGPLIMVVSFVGFVGAWTREIFGPDALLLAGFEWFYALISVAAFIALWKYKQDIMKVIGACAAIGLVHSWVF